MRRWILVSLILTTVGWYALELWAGTVSTYPFGRYEIVLQEGTPVAMGEILGIMRRQTGHPEYPVMLGAQRQALEFNVLGPGNRPYRLASTAFPWPVRSGAGSARFILQRSSAEGELLTLQFRHASRPLHTRLVVNLRSLERMLEGER